jgi:hypothetical protein
MRTSMNVPDSDSWEWEYTEVQAADPAAVIRRYRKKGWELVSVVPVPVTPSARRKPSFTRRNYLLLAVASGLIVLLVFVLTVLGGQPTSQEIPVSQLVRDVRAGRVALIVTQEDSDRLRIYYGDPSRKDTPVVTSAKEPGSNVRQYLIEAGVPAETLAQVDIRVEAASVAGNYLGIAGFCLPLIAFFAVLVWVGWRLQARVQQWTTLVIFRRPANVRVGMEEQAESARDL